MNFKQDQPTTKRLIKVRNDGMPMKLRKTDGIGIKYDCPDKGCTVCKAHF